MVHASPGIANDGGASVEGEGADEQVAHEQLVHNPACNGVQALVLVLVVREVPVDIFRLGSLIAFSKETSIVLVLFEFLNIMINSFFSFIAVVTNSISHGGDDDFPFVEEPFNPRVDVKVREEVLNQVVGGLRTDSLVAVQGP